ncbi:MAG: hypothetical protein WBC06_01280 [Chitinophagaceae bacterium]
MKEVHAFYVERMPGNIPSIPSLIRIDTVTTIYLETTTKLITWDTAFKNNAAYLIRALLNEQSSYEAGRTKKTEEKIIITPGKGLFLWQLQLELIEPGFVAPVIQEYTGNEIILKGKYKGKKLVQKVDKIIELAGTPSV